MENKVKQSKTKYKMSRNWRCPCFF